MLKVLWQGIRAKGEKILISSVFLSSLIVAFLGGSLYKTEEGPSPSLIINVPDYQKAALELKEASPGASVPSKETTAGMEPVVASASPGPETAPSTQTESCPYLGSKNSDKYHLATCGVAKRIKPTNIRCFTSPETAEAAGYKPGCLK